MTNTLQSIVPDPHDLLSLEVEELAGVLLVYLNQCAWESGNTVVQHGKTNRGNFAGIVHYPQQPDRRDEIRRASLEAWAWLVREGPLVEDVSGGVEWFFFSRRAQRLKTREDFAAYRNAGQLPRRQLHAVIASKVYPAFLRGEYDTAIFQAFREVEVAVREAGGYSHDLVGEQLMRAAFAPGNKQKQAPAGPLTDTDLPAAEQAAMAHLFAGAFGVYRNSTAHRYVPTEPSEAVEVIMLASQLLRIVDRLGASTSAMESRSHG
jgi:uncharacterized protein (TIGR02391 family)